MGQEAKSTRSNIKSMLSSAEGSVAPRNFLDIMVGKTTPQSGQSRPEKFQSGD